MVIKTTIPIIEQKCHESGAVDAWRSVCSEGAFISDGEGRPAPGPFLETDLTKWLEAACYALQPEGNPELEEKIEGYIGMIEQAQEADGYLNLFHKFSRPGKRHTDLRCAHELYCAGHLIEAGVAHYLATGRKRLLGVACRLADYLARTFGPNDGQLRATDGHPIIEMALCRLHMATGKRDYLELARFFVDVRGEHPNCFLEERKKPDYPVNRWWDPELDYYQAHKPIREQTMLEGHAVRALYLMAGVTDVAKLTADKELGEVVERLWNNAISKRAYITGGVGSTSYGERFTEDYDLPSMTAYAETCAAIGLIFWAHRRLQAEANATYADVLERALYNGALAGISLEGDRYFYANYLESVPNWHARRKLYQSTRQPWFHCACCPPNLARLIGSIGGYFCSVGKDILRVDCYTALETTVELGGVSVEVRMETEYPFDDKVSVTLKAENDARFNLLLRIPGWSRNPKIAVNGKPLEVNKLENGYLRIEIAFSGVVNVEIDFGFEAEITYPHPNIFELSGKVACTYGPLVFCAEGIDYAYSLSSYEINTEKKPKLERGIGKIPMSILLEGSRLYQSLGDEREELYSAIKAKREPATIRMLPYAFWNNRGESSMRIWMPVSSSL